MTTKMETVRTVVRSHDVPAGKAPASHAVVADNLIYTVGTVGMDDNGELVKGGIKPETEQALKNVRNILKACGSDFDKVLKFNVYMADLNEVIPFSEIYKKVFSGPENYPARTAIQVSMLPMNARVEIECVAVRGRVRTGNQSDL